MNDGVVVTNAANDATNGAGLVGMGTIEPKDYKGITFSTDNLGVSDMAVGSIMYPVYNTVTAREILLYKSYYDTGTAPALMNSTQQEAVQSFVSTWVSQHISPPMSDEEKCRTIYDWIVEHVIYDSQAPNSQSSYGALTEGRCVCAGYTNAFLQLGHSQISFPSLSFTICISPS